MRHAYNKLVRDHIPQIILDSGKQPVTRIAGEGEIHELLAQKLMEEVNEYIKSKDTGELADILEVLRSIAREKGLKLDEICYMADLKKEERGGFERRIVLEEVVDK